MQQSSKHRARPGMGGILGIAAASLLCVAALGQPDPAIAAMHGGGGGFHGGGLHGGGFHGRGFHGGFRGGGFGGFRRNGFRGDRFHHGRFFGGFTGFGFAPYYWGYDYGDYGQPYSQVWYYCADPAGYYPYVTQCNTGWQTVPAS
jgi:hypothetical protein